MIFIGIDGGGTKTSAAAFDESGALLARASGGSVNYNAVGMETARENLKSVLRALPQGYAHAVIGHSALDAEATEREKAAFAGGLAELSRFSMLSDAQVALEAAAPGRDGALIISGTGAMGTARAGQTEVTAGGWGYLLGDPGSGFFIGQEVIKKVLLCSDAGGESGLTAAVLAHFGLHKARELILHIYGEEFSPPRLAALAEVADGLAERGCKEAYNILEEAAGALFSIAESLFKRLGKAVDVYTQGSVLQKSKTVRRRFAALVRQNYPGVPVENPGLPAECGAAIIASARAGADEQALVEGMREAQRQKFQR